MPIHQQTLTAFNLSNGFKTGPPSLSSFKMDSSELSETFYKKLQQLREEHEKTLHMLELLSMMSDARCYQAENYPKIRDTAEGYDESSNYGIFSSEGGSSTFGISDQCANEGDVSQVYYPGENLHFRDVGCDQGPTNSKHFAKVKELWDDFSLRDYITPAMTRKNMKKEARIQTKSAPLRKKEWSPAITVPKPFQMTIREDSKKSESHRSYEQIAGTPQKQLEVEELELQRIVKARDPPAHTFLPIYEEIVERQKERSRVNRQNASSAIRKIVQPFSFMERERLKKKHKDRIKFLNAEKEGRNLSSMVQFVATPVPSSIYDPKISERIREENLYRQIKIKLRSEDLMKDSKLPPHMASHEAVYANRKKKRTEDIRRSMKMPFRPHTHDMPDFEALHRHHVMEQSAREIKVTLPEPFHLQTSKLHKKKVMTQDTTSEIRRKYNSSKKCPDSLLGTTYVPTTDPIPTRMTESARLRLCETRKNLAKAEAELQKLKLEERDRVDRKRKMAKEVSSHFEAFDRSPSHSAEYRQEKLTHYRQQQRARDLEYQRELKEMSNRLKQRPLLFEQQAQNSARLHAQKRYEEVLRSSGLSTDEMNGGGGIGQCGRNTDDDFSDAQFRSHNI